MCVLSCDFVVVVVVWRQRIIAPSEKIQTHTTKFHEWFVRHFTSYSHVKVINPKQPFSLTIVSFPLSHQNKWTELSGRLSQRFKRPVLCICQGSEIEESNFNLWEWILCCRFFMVWNFESQSHTTTNTHEHAHKWNVSINVSFFRLLVGSFKTDRSICNTNDLICESFYHVCCSTPTHTHTHARNTIDFCVVSLSLFVFSFSRIMKKKRSRTLNFYFFAYLLRVIFFPLDCFGKRLDDENVLVI